MNMVRANFGLSPDFAAIEAMMAGEDLPCASAPQSIAAAQPSELEAMITRIVREQFNLFRMEMKTPRSRYAPTVALCIRLTAEAFGCTVEAILGHSLNGDIVKARHAAMWLSAKVSGQYVAEISRRFGRDPKTVQYGIDRTERLRIAYADFADLTTALFGNFKAVA